MPVYEYECKSCSKTFEVMQRFDDPPLLTCDACGGEVRKLISNTSFVLKGNGWYITDYARRSESVPEKADAPKAGEEKKPEAAATETGKAEKTVQSEVAAEPKGTVSVPAGEKGE